MYNVEERGFELGLISKYRQFIYGFCALWIMFFHMSFTIPETLILAPIRYFKNVGNSGVELFLILAAMGMYYSMSAGSSVMRFYKRRLLRVYLPTIVFAASYFIVAHIVADNIEIGEYIRYLFPLVWWLGYDMFWFVPFILTMYLIYPLIYRAQKTMPWLMLLLIPFFMALPTILSQIAPEWTQAREIGLTRIPVFLAGCALAPYIKQNKRVPYAALIIPLAAFFIMRYGKVWPERRFANMYLALFMAAMLPIIAEWISRTRVLRPIDALMRFYGTMSLEVYLIYTRAEDVFINANAFESVNGREYLIAFLCAAITTLAAFILNRACGYIAGKIENTGTDKRAINRKL